MSSCTSIRPVVKVGLIAPFEGLYRETGYVALEAVRQAIADCAPPGVDVLPLALDDSSQPDVAARSAQKLMADPLVIAVIGPYSLPTLAYVGPVMARNDLTWIVPSAVHADGSFAQAPDRPDWQSELIVMTADMAASQGAVSLFVGGLPSDWLDSVQDTVASSPTAIPVHFLLDETDFTQLGAEDALLWLGQPHQAARILVSLHAAQPEATFWLGPQADSPVFSEHVETPFSAYWLTWVTPLYNPAVQPAPGSLTAQLTYTAACQALATMSANDGADRASSPSLQLAVFRIDGDEISELPMDHKLP